MTYRSPLICRRPKEKERLTLKPSKTEILSGDDAIRHHEHIPEHQVEDEFDDDYDARMKDKLMRKRKSKPETTEPVDHLEAMRQVTCAM